MQASLHPPYPSPLPKLTPDQEKFVTALFELCHRYRTANVSSSSIGISQGFYVIQVDILLSEPVEASDNSSVNN